MRPLPLSRWITFACRLFSVAIVLAALLPALACQRYMFPEPLINQPAPEWTMDEVLRTGRYDRPELWAQQGKVVVLNFWGGFDQEAMEGGQRLAALERRFAGAPVVFVTVTREGRERAERVSQARPFPGWLGLDPDGSMFADYMVETLPHTVIIDKWGYVRYVTKPHLVTEATIVSQLEKDEPTRTDHTASAVLP